MAYIATSGSHFRPFTYDELVKPLAQMTEAQNAAADQYDVMSMEAESLRQYLENEPDDSRAKMLYDTYMNRLKTLQDNMWENGYSAGTRRDLAAARGMYAQSVKPIEEAIKTRQERSKAFWDYRHNNPDAITGTDPGLGHIDDYIANPSFGQDWYNYSGNQFAKEVGDDVLAQAQELIRSGQVPEGSQIYGQIMQMLQYGFTNGEVNNVRSAVRNYMNGSQDAFAGLSTNENLLASVLMSHLNATGATDAILNPGDLERFVEYGLSGLSKGVLGSKLNNYNDPRVALQNQIALIDHEYKKKEELESAKAAAKAAEEERRGYSWMAGSRAETSPGYDDYEESLKDYYDQYKDNKSYVVRYGDGTIEEVNDPWRMADIFYNPKVRQDIREKYNGLDIMASITNNFGSGETRYRHFQLKDNNTGKMMDFRLRKMKKEDAEARGLDANTAVYVEFAPNGKWTEYKDASGKPVFSNEISEARETAYGYLNKMSELNPDIAKKLKSLAIPVEKQYSMRKENNIPSTMDAVALKDVMNTKNRYANYTPGVLVDHTDAQKFARESYAGQIYDSWNDANSHQGGVGKGSRFAFYELKPGGASTGEKGETDAAVVFGTRKEGNQDVVNFRSLRNITMSPREAALGANGGRPKVRITTSAQKGKAYLIDVAMLGSELDNKFTMPIDVLDNYNDKALYYQGKIKRGEIGSWSNSDLIDYMMTPILHPEVAVGMDRSDIRAWQDAVEENLAAPPVFKDASDNKWYIATPQMVVRSASLKSRLEDSVARYIDQILGDARNNLEKHHDQTAGMTSNKATDLMDIYYGGLN